MSANYSLYEGLPHPGQWVMVGASSAQCLGFLDPSGEWRDASDGHVIESVESWSPINNIFGEQPVLLPGSHPFRPKGATPERVVRLVNSFPSSAGPSPYPMKPGTLLRPGDAAGGADKPKSAREIK
jgi:hypothetical protein